jgi:DNA polymerase-3 subunit alpha
MCGMLQRKNVRVTKAKKQMCVCQFEDIYGHYEAVMFGRVFDEFASSSVVNNAYLVVGKRRLSNQDAFSMVIDRIIPMPVNDEEIASVMQNRDISRIVNASRSAYKMSSQSDPLQEKTLEKELHIRFNGSLESKEYKRLLNFLAFFHGNLPVVVQSIASNASVRLDDVCSVSDDEGIIDRLKELCGSDNVQIVFK